MREEEEEEEEEAVSEQLADRDVHDHDAGAKFAFLPLLPAAQPPRLATIDTCSLHCYQPRLLAPKHCPITVSVGERERGWESNRLGAGPADRSGGDAKPPKRGGSHRDPLG